MPKKSKKTALKDDVVLNFAMRLCTAEDSGEEDELWDDCVGQLIAIESCRYGVDFIHGSVEKSREWLNAVVPNLDEDRFRQMFRVTRSQFAVIEDLIKDHPVFKSKLQLPVEVQLLITLYRLGCSGEGATVPKLAGLFGVGDGGTIDIATRRVFKALLSHKSTYISWPDAAEREALVATTLHEMPYCVGYVDGTEIALSEKPVLSPDDYYSRKQRFAIKAQIICDHKRRIRSLHVGYPGSVHDARIFSLCEIGKNPANFLSGSQWIAGDSAYKVTGTVIAPFKIHGRPLTDRESRFNYLFSQYRVRVENCIGEMKERFNSLKELRVRISSRENAKFACDWVASCAVLHNLIKADGSEEEFEYIPPEEPEMEFFANDVNEGSQEGIVKRNALVAIMTSQTTK